MTLIEAQNTFESLLAKTTKKAEIKVFNKFLHILTQLRNKDLAKEEINAIEAELESLNLVSNSGNRIKHIRKSLIRFEKYLKDTFSLTAKGYYTNMGIGLGSSFGLVIGIVFLSKFERSLGIAMGVIFGMLIGLIIGRSMDAKAMTEGRVL